MTCHCKKPFEIRLAERTGTYLKALIAAGIGSDEAERLASHWNIAQVHRRFSPEAPVLIGGDEDGV